LSRKNSENINNNENNNIWVESNKIDLTAFEKEKDVSFDKDKEILNLRQINDNLVEKLSNISFPKNNDITPSIPLEKYEKLIHQLNDEQMNYQNVLQALEVVKKENEFYKQLIENKKDNKNNGNPANLSFIHQEINMESKFIENVDEINDLFLDTSPINNINVNNNVEVIKIDSNIHSLSNPPINNNLLGIRKNSGNHEKKSIQSLKTRRTEESIKEQKEYVKENIKENLQKMEENEKLFNEQVFTRLN